MTILYTQNGQQAFDIVEEHPGINLVLMDINMPRLNRFKATRQNIKLRPDLPIRA
ncbi:MAG: response regulator [Chlorobium sp.]|nr:MAG: response regulator [Chlorobium sp.]